jgi:hypothetical protein
MATAQIDLDKMQKIVDALNGDFSFPYQNIRVEHGLGDYVSIVLTLEPKEEWPYRIMHNAKYFIALLHLDDKEGTFDFNIASNGTKIKLMQKKNLTTDKAICFISNQLKKLQM